MFNPKSDYALNKIDPEAIIYTDSWGTLVQLTLEDFASPEEFQRWKEWSDNDYHKTDNADTLFSKRALSLHSLSERAVISQSPEDVLVEAQELRERRELYRSLMKALETCLTATQRRRLWLHCVNGLTVRQIAEAEGVQHPSIVECLTAARKKLLAFLKNLE